ncbi:hypothetical protein [Streptomyces sp. NPDC005336]|uniref:hypothetical protein n=1 Tax=unclassified Streptomyces TaxID=2593676 RepID=UPI0033AF2DB1
MGTDTVGTGAAADDFGVPSGTGTTGVFAPLSPRRSWKEDVNRVFVQISTVVGSAG